MATSRAGREIVHRLTNAFVSKGKDFPAQKAPRYTRQIFYTPTEAEAKQGWYWKGGFSSKGEPVLRKIFLPVEELQLHRENFSRMRAAQNRKSARKVGFMQRLARRLFA